MTALRAALGLFHIGQRAAAGRAGEKAALRGDGRSAKSLGKRPDAGGVLRKGAGPLPGGIQRDQGFEGHMPLEPGNPKLGHIQLLFNAKAAFFQQPPDCFGMKVNIQLRKLHLLRRKGVQLLTAEDSADGLEVAFVGEFQQELRVLVIPAGRSQALNGLRMWCRVRIMVAPSNNPSTKGSL